MSVNGTQVEDKMRRFKGECAQFSFNRCPIYTHDGTSVKFSTNSQETDNSVGLYWLNLIGLSLVYADPVPRLNVYGKSAILLNPYAWQAG